MLLLVAFWVVGTASVASASVVDLTDADFASRIAEGRWFVEAYAPWCGFCKRLEPVWSELAGELAAQKNVHVARIDCVAEPRTCEHLGVRGYPTLKLFQDGKMYDFEGGDRSLEALKQFVNNGWQSARQVNDVPPLGGGSKQAAAGGGGGGGGEKKLIKESDVMVPMLTEESFTDVTSTGRWLVAATAAWCGHCKALQPTLEALAIYASEGFETAQVDCDESTSVCHSLGVKSFPTIFVIEKGTAYRYDGNDRSSLALKKFAQKGYTSAKVTVPIAVATDASLRVAKRGSLILLNEDTFDEATGTDAWLVGYVEDDSDSPLQEALQKVQRTYSIHLRVGIVDCSDSEKLCKSHKISKPPAVRLLYLDNVFEYDQNDLSSDSLAAFIGEGFKSAPKSQRRHIAVQRRLDWSTWNDARALEDFVRQHRSILVLCVIFGFIVYGVILGGALSTSPVRMYRLGYLKGQEAAKQKSGGGGGGVGGKSSEYLVKKKKN